MYLIYGYESSKMLFLLSRDCHLLSYSNSRFHCHNTVAILDSLSMYTISSDSAPSISAILRLVHTHRATSHPIVIQIVDIFALQENKMAKSDVTQINQTQLSLTTLFSAFLFLLNSISTINDV